MQQNTRDDGLGGAVSPHTDLAIVPFPSRNVVDGMTAGGNPPVISSVNGKAWATGSRGLYVVGEKGVSVRARLDLSWCSCVL